MDTTKQRTEDNDKSCFQSFSIEPHAPLVVMCFILCNLSIAPSGFLRPVD